MNIVDPFRRSEMIDRWQCSWSL